MRRKRILELEEIIITLNPQSPAVSGDEEKRGTLKPEKILEKVREMVEMDTFKCEAELTTSYKEL